MARTSAGYRYPHATTDAREHDHRFCPVIAAIAARVADGTEEWGTPHPMPAVAGETTAEDARRGLFRGRSCSRVTGRHGQLSVQVRYVTPDGESPRPARGPSGYVLLVRVWPRTAGRGEISRRVRDGQPLPYNALKGKT